MPANTRPIVPLTPKISWAKLSTANEARDGTGDVGTVYTAGENGSRIDQIKVRSLGTNESTVLRFFINNGQDSSVGTNNSLVHEVTIPSTTESQNSDIGDNDVIISKGYDSVVPIPYLPAGYKINCAIGSTIAAGVQVTVWGADY